MRPTLAGTDPRLLERRLKAAWLAIPAELPCRPEPRHVFDNVAAGDGRAKPKGADLLQILQGVMDAAIATKDLSVVERTQVTIITYVDEILSQALLKSPLLSKVAFEDIACHAMEESGKALTIIGKAGTTRNAGMIDQAVTEAGQAVVALEEFREVAAARAARQTMRVQR